MVMMDTAQANAIINEFFDKNGKPSINYFSPKEFQKCFDHFSGMWYYVGVPDPPNPNLPHLIKRQGEWYMVFAGDPANNYKKVTAAVGSSELEGVFW